jgi:hypothetical protein
MSHEIRPIEVLIAQARSGDQTAVAQLSRWCMPVVKNLALERLGKKRPGIVDTASQQLP